MADSSESTEWNHESIRRCILALHRDGQDLSYSRMSRERHGLLAAANYHFGSWGRAVEAAGIDYHGEVRRIPRWTKDKIINLLREAHADGEDLSWTSVTGGSQYSALAYAAIRDNRFGSWDAALRAAGIDPASVRRYESWSKPKIIRRIQARRAACKPLNSKAMQEQASRLFNAALNHFGAWDRALEAAQVDPDEVYKRRRWSRETIKREITDLYGEGEDLAAGRVRENHSCLYSAACKYFGSWAAALDACPVDRKAAAEH